MSKENETDQMSGQDCFDHDKLEHFPQQPEATISHKKAASHLPPRSGGDSALPAYQPDHQDEDGVGEAASIATGDKRKKVRISKLKPRNPFKFKHRRSSKQKKISSVQAPVRVPDHDFIPRVPNDFPLPECTYTVPELTQDASDKTRRDQDSTIVGVPENQVEQLLAEISELVQKLNEAEEIVKQMQKLAAENEEARQREIEKILNKASEKHKMEMKQELDELEEANKKELVDTIARTTTQLREKDEEIAKLKARLVEKDKLFQEELTVVNTANQQAIEALEEKCRELDQEYTVYRHGDSQLKSIFFKELKKQMSLSERASESTDQTGVEPTQIHRHNIENCVRDREVSEKLEFYKLMAETYAEDFMNERKDREEAHSMLASLEIPYIRMKEQSEKMHNLFRAANAHLQEQVNWLNKTVLQQSVRCTLEQNDGIEKAQAKDPSDELQPFVLQEPLDLGNVIASGCYGAVYSSTIGGFPCIAKRLLDILVGRGREERVSKDGKEKMMSNFCRECKILSKVRHPNIVQFMGVHCDRDSVDQDDVSLIMEQLPTDLDRLLENCQSNRHCFDLPLSFQVCLLSDIASGLQYLHSQSILHRDLKAENVLITAEFKAKIADLGASKIFGDEKWYQKLSKVPGALGYMPPEACVENPKYCEKIDVFSFGVLALYIAIQEYPEFTYEHVPDRVHRKGEGEIFKRKKWFTQMKAKRHPFQELVHQCLLDQPDRRLDTDKVVGIVSKMREAHTCTMQETLVVFSHFSDSIVERLAIYDCTV